MPDAPKSFHLSPEIHEYVVRHGAPPDEIASALIEETKQLGGISMMQIAPEQGAFMTLLARLIGARRAIEVGTFTGYSALSYLTNMPISELKIDRSFVRELGLAPKSSDIVTAIIALGRSLGLRVVAEGVETLRQMEVLHRLGCRLMQGFLFSRPLPPEEMQAWREQTLLAQQAPWIIERGDEGPDDLPRSKLLRAAGVLPRP